MIYFGKIRNNKAISSKQTSFYILKIVIINIIFYSLFIILQLIKCEVYQNCDKSVIKHNAFKPLQDRKLNAYTWKIFFYFLLLNKKK